MGINSLMQLSSDLIGAMATEIENDNADVAMKNLYKKMMLMLMSALGGGDEMLFQFTYMRDALNELINEIQNGDAIIAE